MINWAARAHNPDEADHCLSLGFDRIEITLPCPGGALEEAAWAELGRRNRVRFLAHGPQEGDPRDLEQLERHYLPRLREAVRAAGRLGAAPLTVHMWLESRFLPDQVIRKKIEFLARVVEWGEKQGVPINLENLSESADDLGRALRIVPALDLTLDVGHAQLLSDRNTSFAIIERFFDRITHLHLHDNHGGNSPRDDLHLIPGQGNVPFERLFSKFKQRGYQGTATMELKPDQLEEAGSFLRAAWEKA